MGRRRDSGVREVQGPGRPLIHFDTWPQDLNLAPNIERPVLDSFSSLRVIYPEESTGRRYVVDSIWYAGNSWIFDRAE